MVLKERNHATSGSDIWLGPSLASVIPACEPTSLRFAPLLMAISIWSYPRFEILRDQSQSFAAIAGFKQNPYNLSGTDTADQPHVAGAPGGH